MDRRQLVRIAPLSQIAVWIERRYPLRRVLGMELTEVGYIEGSEEGVRDD